MVDGSVKVAVADYKQVWVQGSCFRHLLLPVSPETGLGPSFGPSSLSTWLLLVGLTCHSFPNGLSSPLHLLVGLYPQMRSREMS